MALASGLHQDSIVHFSMQLADAGRNDCPHQASLWFGRISNADGLTHGLFLTLQKIFQDTPYVERFMSADAILSRLRGRKTPTEIRFIRAAIDRTLILFDETTARLKTGLTEKEIARHFHDRCVEWKVDTAWAWLAPPQTELWLVRG